MESAHKDISSPIQTASIRSPISKDIESKNVDKKENTKSVKKVLLTTPDSKPKKKTVPKENGTTNSTTKTPAKTPVKTPAGKSSTKKTPKTATASSKKKKLSQLEAEEKEIQASIEKLKKEKKSLSLKLSKLSVEKTVKFPVPDELISTYDVRPSLIIPEAYTKLEDTLPKDVVTDAISVWDFFNTFSKQLVITNLTWEDFITLLTYNENTSMALIDLVTSPLRLILADITLLQRVLSLLPNKVHFAIRSSSLLSDEQKKHAELTALTDENTYNNATSGNLGSMTPGRALLNSGGDITSLYNIFPGGSTAINVDDFDNEYNGMKLILRRNLVDSLDNMRYNVVLRAVLLRLEPVCQLRKAIQEVTIAYQHTIGIHNNVDDEEKKAEEEQLLSELVQLNFDFYNPLSKNVKFPNSNKVQFLTPSKAPSGNVNNESFATPCPSTSCKHIITQATLTKINAPKSKSQNNKAGLNKDAIFHVTSNYITSLQNVHHITRQLEKLEVHQLPVQDKILLLKLLCSTCYETKRIQELIAHNAEERATQLTQMNKLLREQKVKLKEVSSNKKQIAANLCRKLNEAFAVAELKKKEEQEKTEAKEGDRRKRGRKLTAAASSKANKEYEPTTEQINQMVDDLVMLENYRIDTIIPDFPLEDIPSDSDDEEDRTDRNKSKEYTKWKKDALYRNNILESAYERLQYAVETKSERELKGAIRSGERAGLKGTDDDDRVYVSQSLRLAYRALNELEAKAKENKTQQKHEQALQEFFVRTEPLGFDRNRRIYWQFSGDSGRLFVETKQMISEDEYSGLQPPPLLTQNPSTVEEEENKMLYVLFQSRPHRYRSTWHVYSTPTELYRLWYSLDERGEREKELKELIASRYELEEPKQEYSTTGSEYIGRQVTRTFGSKVVIGTIVGWLPPSDEDQALWHIVHGDGDEEDLDLQEVQAYLVPLPGEETAEDAEVDGEDGEQENEDDAEGEDENEDGDENEVDDVEKEDVAMDVEETKSAISNAPSNVSIKTSTTNQTSSGVPSKRRIIIDDDEEDEMSDPGIGVDNADNNASSNMNTSKGTIKSALPLIPKILKQPYGLSKPSTYARNVPAIGISGIEQELLRLMQIYYDNFKKRTSNTEDGASVMSKELRKHYDNRVTSMFSLHEAKEIILDIEELIHSIQTVPDKLDLEEELKKQQVKRQEMLAEGWVFEDTVDDPMAGVAYLGCRARRFFPEFGKSDCTVHAMLPAVKNDGIQLFRLVHSDNDEEDVDETDVALAVECFKQHIETEEAMKLLVNGIPDAIEETNTSTSSTALLLSQKKSKKADNDTDEIEEDEEEGGDQVEVDYYAEPGSEDELDAVEKLTKASHLLLWPTKEIRGRWRNIVLNSQTVGELAMALTVLEEQSYRFGMLDHDTGASTALYGSTSSVVPLMLFRPPVSAAAAAAAKAPAKTSSRHANVSSVVPAERTYRTQGGGHHRMLSPRKAKKRAIGELSRYDNSWDSDNNNNDDDDFEDDESDGYKSSRYPKRSTRSAAVSSSSSGYGNSDYYNSGRPSRAVTQKVVSYAE